MFISVNDQKHRILKQNIRLKKRISNRDLFLIQYFHQITQIYPKNVILHRNFILFFVKNSQYFRCTRKLRKLRYKIPSKKILIIRDINNTNLLKLLFGFFPDIFIDDISLKIQKEKRILLIILKLLTYRERMIAIGAEGQYIKILNYIINRFFLFEQSYKQIIIKCEVD
jgi:hypothetical protein